MLGWMLGAGVALPAVYFLTPAAPPQHADAVNSTASRGFNEVQMLGGNLTVLVPRNGFQRRREQYQDLILRETEIFRPPPPQDPAEVEWEGRELSPRVFKYWLQERQRGTNMGDRIFITMHVWDCLYRCKERDSVDRMADYMHALDNSFKYFLILGMDKAAPSSKVQFVPIV